MKTHYSAAELAALKLPNLPGTERNIRAMADREGWSFVEAPGRGGKTGKRREFALGSLPESARLVLAESAVVSQASLPVPAAKLPAVNVDQPLKTHQIDSEMARERIFKFIADFEGPQTRAIDYLNSGYHTKTLTGPMTWAMDNAWGKRRADARLTASTLAKWKTVKQQRGRSAPLVRQKDMEVKPWHALAVSLKQRPQGSCLTWITEQIEENWNPVWGKAAPSYTVICRFFKDKFSQIDQLEGRHTGSALAPHKHYTKRSNAGMLPWDELHADGWNTHFTAPHPVTGEYVTYELWHAHDVATRFVPPFGIGLTENFDVITKCVEEAVRFGGVPAILQTDSTKIIKANDKFMMLADRVGFTTLHPQTVGNSQANGIAENFNTWMDKESRELATYQAKGMDGLVLKRVKKLTAKAVKAKNQGDYDAYALAVHEAERIGKGRVFTSRQETCEWLEEKRQKWNDKPHAALPKISDPLTGKKRHQSPSEALLAARNNGWAPDLFDEDYMQVLFRTHVRATVRREAVSPYGGMRYHHADLGDWNGKEVVVAYDIMDHRQVWVKTLAGELICTANFSEATGYRTVTAKQAADEKRALAQIKHRERQINKIKERVGLDAIDGESTRVPELAEVVSLAPRLSDAELAAMEARQQPAKVWNETEFSIYMFGDPMDKDMADEDMPPIKESATG